jgi:hypothetical protein
MEETEQLDDLVNGHETLLNSYLGSSMADQAVVASMLAVFAASTSPEETATRLATMKSAALAFLQAPLSDPDMPENIRETVKARIETTFKCASQFRIN